MMTIQVLQQRPATILIPRNIKALRAAAAAELSRSAHCTKVEVLMRLSRCFPVALWGAIAGVTLSLPVPADAEVTEGVLHMTQVT
jgi:hypothetical protein